MAVLDYVMLGRTPHISPLGRESAADLAGVDSLLRRLGLLPFAGRMLSTLSGGGRARAFPARGAGPGRTPYRERGREGKGGRYWRDWSSDVCSSDLWRCSTT